MLSVREPHVPILVRNSRIVRTGAVSVPSMPVLYGLAATAGAVVGGVAYLGSKLLGSAPLVGALGGGAVSGAVIFGGVAFATS